MNIKNLLCRLLGHRWAHLEWWDQPKPPRTLIRWKCQRCGAITMTTHAMLERKN